MDIKLQYGNKIKINMNVLNVCCKIRDIELEIRGCMFMEYNLRKIIFVGNEEII